MKKIISQIVLISVASFQLFGCGSGSSVALPQAQKTATVTFSVSTTASLPTAVRAITITAKMPPGVTVPVVGSSKLVDSAALVPLKAGSLVFGTYSAPLVIINVNGNPTSVTSLGLNNVGDFVRLLVSFPQGTAITESSFTSINNPPGFAATGVSGTPPNQTTEVLTGFFKPPSLKVTF